MTCGAGVRVTKKDGSTEFFMHTDITKVEILTAGGKKVSELASPM